MARCDRYKPEAAMVTRSPEVMKEEMLVRVNDHQVGAVEN